MDDMQTLVKEFFDELREFVQPVRKKKKLRIVRLLAIVSGLIVGTVVAVVTREYRKVPNFDCTDN
jgi:hypothetical protein